MKKIFLFIFLLSSIASAAQWKHYKDRKQVDSLKVGDSVITMESIARYQQGGGEGGGHTIENDGVPATNRSALNFLNPIIVEDDAGNDATKVRIQYADAELDGVISTADWNTFNDKQPGNANLTTIAGLTPTTDNFIVSVSSAWASRTPVQVKTTLALDNVNNTSDATKNSATATLTNKRITKRTGTVASSATPTINTDNVDLFTITAQTEAITSMTTNLSGTPNEGDQLEIWITGTASRAITWGASFAASSIALPTTTSGTSTLRTVFIRNGSTWVIKGFY